MTIRRHGRQTFWRQAAGEEGVHANETALAFWAVLPSRHRRDVRGRGAPRPGNSAIASANPPTPWTSSQDPKVALTW